VTLRDARLDAGLTQADVANRIGTTQSSISDWEAGVSVPLATSLDLWAAVFGLVPILVKAVDS
jgi:transcriptional regulator with XRE-family HTH domain